MISTSLVSGQLAVTYFYLLTKPIIRTARKYLQIAATFKVPGLPISAQNNIYRHLVTQNHSQIIC